MLLYMLSLSALQAKYLEKKNKNTKRTLKLGDKTNQKDIVPKIVLKTYARFLPFLWWSSLSRYFNAINSVFDNSATNSPTSISLGWKELALKFKLSLSTSIKPWFKCFTLNTSKVFKWLERRSQYALSFIFTTKLTLYIIYYRLI